MRYRPGDVLLVRATVASSDRLPAGYLLAKFGVCDKRDLCLNVEYLDVASVERTRIEVGDTVRRTSPSGPLTGEVLAFHDDALWVQLTTGQYQTWRTSECERVD